VSIEVDFVRANLEATVFMVIQKKIMDWLQLSKLEVLP
jgi:hypothetical protein